jgi:hypothetical protein
MFYVGQRVICIDADWGPIAQEFNGHPQVGDIVVIAKIVTPPSHARPCDHFGLPGIPHYMYASTNFRPIVETKTDISIFTRLLVPGTKILEDA